TLVDDQTRGRYVAEQLARRANLEPLAGGHVAGHAAMYDDGGAVDLCIDDRAFTDDERVLGRDLTFDLPLDAHRALEGELAGDPAALAKERARAARLLGLGPSIQLALEHLHLPGHRTGRRRHAGLGAHPAGSVTPLTVLAE